MASLPAQSKYTITYATTTDSSPAGSSQPVYYYTNDPSWTQTHYPLYPGNVVLVCSPKDWYVLPKLEEPFDEEALLLEEDF